MNELPAVWHFGELKSEEDLQLHFSVMDSRHIRLSCPVDIIDCNLLFHACMHIFKDTHHEEKNGFQKLIAYNKYMQYTPCHQAIQFTLTVWVYI